MIVEASFLRVTSLATKLALKTAYINNNIEKFIFKNGILDPKCWSPIAIVERLCDAALYANIVETKQWCSEQYCSAYMCFALYSRVMIPISKVYLFIRWKAQSVHFVTSHENVAKKRIVLLGQDLVNVVFSQLSIIEMESWSSK